MSFKLLAFALMGLILVGCTGNKFFSDGKAKVTVQNVFIEEKQKTMNIPATLEPSAKVDFQFPIDVKTDQVQAQLGDSVAQGDLLFSIREQPFQLQISKMRNKLLEQEALLEKNLYFLQNRDRLLEQGKIDQEMHDTLEAEVKALEAATATLRTDIAIIENQLAHVNITAPFNGIVTGVHIVPNTEAPSGRTLMSLVQANPIYLTFEVPAADSGSITNGMTLNAKIKELGGETLPAAVIFISPELTTGQTYTVKATLPNDTLRLKGGMRGEVQFVSPRKFRVLSIPNEAVLREGDKEFAYTVRENKAWRVRIFTRPNSENPDLTDVLEGLHESDLVVTEGFEGLKTGVEVNLWR